MKSLNSGYNRDADDLYAPAWISSEQEPEQLFSEIVPGLFQGGTPDEDWDAISGASRRGGSARGW